MNVKIGTLRIFPSLMSKSQQELNTDLKKLRGVVRELHLDVVDGKFAPNHTFQFQFKLSSAFNYNVHLMVNSPEKWVDRYGDKVDTIIFHPEVLAKKEVWGLIQKIRNKHKKVGLALKPETAVKQVADYLGMIDYLLILTVHPGFYSSNYLPSNLDKIKLAKRFNHKIKVIVDGGMRPETIGKAASFGADYFVSGSYTTKSENPTESIKKLMGIIKQKREK